MDVLATFAFILVTLAIGRVLSWRRIVPDNAADSLNLVVLFVCLPAAVLLYAPKLTLERELLGLVAIPWIVLLASTVLVTIVARISRMQGDARACLLVQIPLGNTSFIGYAVVPVLAGAGALRYAVVYDQLGTFLILVTWGLMAIALYSGGERPTALAILRRIATFPPFLALLAALTVVPAELPVAVERSLHLFADALLPIVVLALGMQLRLRVPRRHVLPLAMGLLAKLVLMPLLALALATLFGLTGEVRAVAVYLTAMPPMVTSGALLALAGIAPELAVALVGYGIVASMLTLPMWYLVLG